MKRSTAALTQTGIPDLAVHREVNLRLTQNITKIKSVKKGESKKRRGMDRKKRKIKRDSVFFDGKGVLFCDFCCIVKSFDVLSI